MSHIVSPSSTSIPSSINPPTTDTLQVVVGLGKTGLSCIRFLAAQGRRFAVTDSRENPPGLAEIRQHFPGTPLSLGAFDAKLCAQANQLIVSPGVSLQEPAIAQAIANGVPAISDIELFAQIASAPVVVITGSNGKSTVTTLLGAMATQAGLNAKIGGNLGIPVLDLLAGQEPDVYILELSSFQLEATFSLKAKAAVILNLCEDHMDRYLSLQDYLTAKQRIYHHCQIAIVNRNEPTLWERPSAANTWQTAISFGLDAPLPGQFGLRQVANHWYLAQGNELLIASSALKIKGRHQLANALSALALGHAIGLPMAAMLAALGDFQGLVHRCQWVASSQGVDWYNDSKATNVGATLAALAGLGAETAGKLIVIAGGQGKNADFSQLSEVMRKYARHLILLGMDAPQLAVALKDHVPIQQVVTLEQAVAAAYSYAQPGDTVILAPACASLDMFRHFEHRGEVFIAAVKKLLNHP